MSNWTIAEQLLELIVAEAPVRDARVIGALVRAGAATLHDTGRVELTVEGWEVVDRILLARARGIPTEEVVLSSNAFILAPLCKFRARARN